MTGGPNRDVLGLEHVFRRLSGLLSLEICDYGALKRAEFTTLCSVVTSLTQLSLRGCRISAGWKEGPPDMSTLRSLTHLQTLDLSRCVVSALETANGTANTQSMVSDELLGALGQLPFLSTLRVAESSNITAVGLKPSRRECHPSRCLISHVVVACSKVSTKRIRTCCMRPSPRLWWIGL